MIHLDTSFLIRSLARGTQEDAALRQWLRAGESLAIDAIAWTEFLCGPLSSDAIAVAGQLLGEPVPFGASESEVAARLFNESGRRRGTLVDCMIAAGAIQRGAALATSNDADFRRLAPFGLELITTR
ncbi:MAG: type II toxin-antitoxin system VapC family toxin [Gemmatimonadaceae bacterium]